MIDEKDQVLYTDLMRLQDQLNLKRIQTQGFKPDSTSVSSIMINEIQTTGVDYLKREKDDLQRCITADQAEIEKIMKITSKYRENLAKQAAQESNAIEMLNLQEEELRSLHDESRGLATELHQERRAITKDRTDNTHKLQQLYNFDVRMQHVKETIEKRESQIHDLEIERDEFENKLEVVKTRIEKTMKVTTVRPRKYRAIKGDSVDEMLANVLNIKNCEIPISRIGDGWYMFGSKKIYAKIMNNKLVCRVGGGFSNMEDYIREYAESERLKLERMDPHEIEALHSKNMDKHMIKTVPMSNRAGSPKATAAKGSPKAGGTQPSYMGSPRMRRNNSGSLKKLP